MSVDLNGLDNFRAAIALEKHLQELPQIPYFADFFARDCVEKEHEPFVFSENGSVILSHERVGDTVNIYSEEML